MTALLAGAAGAQPLTSITGRSVACVSGWAAEHACSGIDLMARMSLDDLYVRSPGDTTSSDLRLLNDIWGWTDPLTGREYALVGRDDAVAFVDVTNPIEPAYLGYLPSHDGARSWWRDMKVYKDHMFVVVDADGANGMQVFDLTALRRHSGAPTRYGNSAHYDGVGMAHNLAINEETGFAYILGGDSECAGLHMVDIHDPADPFFVGCFAETNTGWAGKGYVHDAQCVIYRGPDSQYSGRELCFGLNENAVSVTDVTDKVYPVTLAYAAYPNVSYTHQGWLTEDHMYFVINDEEDERAELQAVGSARTRTLIWDVVDVDDPVMIAEHFGQTIAIDHNLYIRKNYVFASNYTNGLRILDIEDPRNPREIAFFDTHPESDTLSFDGAWSNFPFFASGIVVVSSHPDGLLILNPTSLDLSRVAASDNADIPAALVLSGAYPNPFNPSTTVTVLVPGAANVTVNAFDLLGRRVAQLFDGPLSAGSHQVVFEGTGLSSGTYVVRAQAGRLTASQHVTLLK